MTAHITPLGSFYVCDNEFFEFYLNLLVTGEMFTQIEELGLFLGDGAGNPVGDPLIMTASDKDMLTMNA